MEKQKFTRLGARGGDQRPSSGMTTFALESGEIIRISASENAIAFRYQRNGNPTRGDCFLLEIGEDDGYLLWSVMSSVAEFEPERPGFGASEYSLSFSSGVLFRLERAPSKCRLFVADFVQESFFGAAVTPDELRSISYALSAGVNILRHEARRRAHA